MPLSTLLDTKLEIPISDIGDYIKKQKESLVSAIKNHNKKYGAAKTAREALKSYPPVRPPDGPTRPAIPTNRPLADLNLGYRGIYRAAAKLLVPIMPNLEPYEIPLARKEDFVQIEAPPACSGVCSPSNGTYIRGDSIGHGMFIPGERMAPPDPDMINRANALLETAEEINPKPPRSRDIREITDPELKQIFDILQKHRIRK